jgi:hypothetical protein
MTSLVAASLFTLLVMAATTFAAERPDPASIPPEGIEGPGWRSASVETRPDLTCLQVR